MEDSVSSRLVGFRLCLRSDQGQPPDGRAAGVAAARPGAGADAGARARRQGEGAPAARARLDLVARGHRRRPARRRRRPPQRPHRVRQGELLLRPVRP